MKSFKRNLILILILILGIGLGFYGNTILNYLKDFGKQEDKKEEVATPTPASSERKFPAGFSKEGLKEKELDVNNDGRGELLLTSLAASGPQAVLVDPKDSSKALSDVFKFPQAGFAAEFIFKSGETPEVTQAIDLNADGVDELIFDLKDYGAYTSSYGVVSFSNKKLNWIAIESKGGGSRPAVFRDGASVRHAEVFLVEEGAKRAIADISGGGDNQGNWTWEVEAYSWTDGKYKFDSALSAQILSEQPKKIIDGQPVF